MHKQSRLRTLTIAGTYGEYTSCQQLQRRHRNSTRERETVRRAFNFRLLKRMPAVTK